MKIGVADPNKFKFSGQLINHWQSQGHHLLAHVCNLEEHEFCDVVFYDAASANVAFYCKNMKRQKKVIVRALDVENYMNYYKDFNWDKIDHLIFLNESQKKLLTSHSDFTCPEEKMLIIPPGVNMNIYTIPKKKRGKKAVFVGRGWIGKNAVGAIDVIYELNKIDPGWELYLRTDKFDPRWWTKYFDYRVSRCGFPIHIEEETEDMKRYLDDKDLMIVSSFKEAFSYVAAEAMAMGIPTVINDWYGSEDVWPKELIYTTPSEAASSALKLINRPPEYFRDIIKDRYDEEIMFKKIDALL